MPWVQKFLFDVSGIKRPVDSMIAFFEEKVHPATAISQGRERRI
jgi:hypothetical protein